MGLLMIAALEASGAQKVFVTEKSEFRQQLAARLGAQPLVSSDPIAELNALTNGDGVDVAFECVGSPGAFSVAYGGVRRGGRLVQVGVAPFDSQIPVTVRDMWVRMITIIPACGIESTWDRALAWLLRLPVDQIITHDFGLEQANEAVAVARSGRAGKIMLQPNYQFESGTHKVEEALGRVG
jgi:L-iditol 2-dehydrogenase